jgi:two-component system chemotaxis response regulator CheY
MAAQRVLSVGQCNPDHAAISRMLTDLFDVEVDRVMFVDEAVSALAERAYDLVLVNRLIFEDNSPGIDLIHHMRADPRSRGVPVMMVSNYPEAQAQAIAAGAVTGFGKDHLFKPETADRLAGYLKRR